MHFLQCKENVPLATNKTILEKIFSTILRKFKMGKVFEEKTVLDLFMRNGVVCCILTAQNNCLYTWLQWSDVIGQWAKWNHLLLWLKYAHREFIGVSWTPSKNRHKLVHICAMSQNKRFDFSTLNMKVFLWKENDRACLGYRWWNDRLFIERKYIKAWKCYHHSFSMMTFVFEDTFTCKD